MITWLCPVISMKRSHELYFYLVNCRTNRCPYIENRKISEIIIIITHVAVIPLCKGIMVLFCIQCEYRLTLNETTLILLAAFTIV